LCYNGYYGEKCENKIYTCNNIQSIDSSVCNGNGNCVGNEVCSCKIGWIGYQCQQMKTYQCFSRLLNDITVCNGNGICISQDNCSCNIGYIGNECQIKIPYFYSQNLKCWGKNNNGQIGNGLYDSMFNSPQLVYNFGNLANKTVIKVSTGFSHTCSITNDNQLYCWGSNM
jgi:hypothetical protein